MLTTEGQYLNLVDRILIEGVWVENKRTGTRCLTVMDANLTTDCQDMQIPILTVRKMNYKGAMAEMLGYIKGYNSAKEFRELGCNTWDANANENKDWLDNKAREGTDDLGSGFAYSQGRQWGNTFIDQYENIVGKLNDGDYDRRLIMTFLNISDYSSSALQPCMHTHTFSVLKDKLYLTSYQRSCDVLLGGAFNIIQTAFLLMLTAHITGLKPGKVYHKIVDAHIYENQYKVFKGFSNFITPEPHLEIDSNIKTLEDIDSWVNMDNFKVPDYESAEPMYIPFTV